MVRTLTSDEGLTLGEVHGLAQDDQGGVWFGHYGGVSRWDGARAVQADGGRIRESVEDVVVDGQGVTWALTERTRRVFQVKGARTAVVPGPDGSPLRASAITRDPAGRLLAVVGERVFRRRAGFWEALRASPLLRACTGLRVLANGDLLVFRRAEAWRLPSVGAPRRMVARPYWIRDAQELADGSVWFADRQVVRVDAEGRQLQRIDLDLSARALDLAPDGSVWVGATGGVARIAPDGSVERLTEAREGVHAGGDLMVDAEGSIWLGSFDGVHQITAPGIRRWGVPEGLPTQLTRTVRATPDGILFTNWNTPGWIDPVTRTAGLFEGAEGSKSQVCRDGTGRSWAVTATARDPHEVLGIDGRSVTVRLPIDGPMRGSFIEACTVDRQGGVWMSVGDELWRLRGDEAVERHAMPHAAFGRGRGRGLFVDGDELIVAVDRRVCHERLARVEARTADWRCTDLPRATWVEGLARSSAGRLWAATSTDVYTLDPEGWRVVPGLLDRPSEVMTALTPASEGGLWIGGHGTVLRVRDRPDHPNGFEVIEDLSGWLAPHVGTVRSMAEDASGTLWIAHSAGITEVPRADQHPDLSPPSIGFDEILLDGAPTDSRVLPLPDPGSHVRVRATAPSHRAPRLLRFRSRVDGGAWTQPVRDAIYELQGLKPGRHTLEIAASLDQVRWSDPPARLEVLVPTVWYARADLWMLVIGGIGLLALAIQRLRANLALRVERVRTRIALDLHDEVGAGLGAMSLLGSLLKRDLPTQAIHGVGDDIVDTSTELSRALRAIVWSLQPSSRTLGELADYLTDRARRILADLHEQGGLEVDIDPRCAEVRLDLDVLRAAQLIALEALHNAARHARADHVRLAVERDRRRWVLVVEDDGIGLQASASREERPDSTGLGLDGMRHRAEQVGATLTVQSEAGSGTRVRLALPVTSRWLA